MREKRNILVFIDWYLPAYKAGGPVKSMEAMVFYLKNEFNFYIITGNKDLFSEEPHKNIKSNTWHVLPNGEHVFYFSDNHFSFKNLQALVAGMEYDLVYLNSFFSKRFTIYPLLLKKINYIKAPFVIAPRGMLGAGALSLKSKKKSIFIALAKAVGLYKNSCWHATSLQEAGEIKHVFGGRATIKTISNLILPPVKSRDNYDKQVGDVKICFVSRIAEKKNLAFALQILQSIKNGNIVFDIYGPAEDKNYLERCKRLANEMPNNIEVNFKGELQGEEVAKTLVKYHLFFMPTLNENFGHAIVEAMFNGCLPLLSNTTPWRNLQVQNLGWDIPLNDIEKFRSAINEVLMMNNKTFEERSKAIQQYAYKNCIDASTTNTYKELFNA